MAMSVILFLFLLLSVSSAVLNGTGAAVSAAIAVGAQSAVTLGLTLAGMLCLWSGVARVMEDSGLSERLARLLRPLLTRLFPESCKDAAICRAISGNVSANLLGLGNAATPLGIQAITRMRELHPSDTATDEMCRLIVLNTASIQLLPTTVAAIRAGCGAEAPFSILPAVWLTSVCSVTAGLLSARLLQRFSKWR